MKFETVKEVTSWKNFKIDGNTYDLSHLNAQRVEYLDERDEEKPVEYRFIVTYGLHCFTKDLENLSREESQLLMYSAPRESRQFNFERYELSKQLPIIIQKLGNKETLVCHAGYGNFATVKALDKNGSEIDYFVPFSLAGDNMGLDYI